MFISKCTYRINCVNKFGPSEKRGGFVSVREWTKAIDFLTGKVHNNKRTPPIYMFVMRKQGYNQVNIHIVIDV
jgi:hypothetical protein